MGANIPEGPAEGVEMTAGDAPKLPADVGACPDALEALNPVDLADLILWLAAQPGRDFVALDPTTDRHSLVTTTRGARHVLASIRPSLADATAARIALIGDLDLAAPGEQLRRAAVRIGDRHVEILLTLRPTPKGLFLETRAIPTAADSPDTEVSDTKLDRIGIYTILGEIGHGAMGVVYRAEHDALKKPVAIKVLHKRLAADPLIAARFEREGLAASRARHPGIVDVTDFGRLANGQSFLVMELVEAHTLDHVIAKSGALQPERAVRIVRDIGGALAAAHAVGVVHRDLKPANIFLLDGDRVKIGDFGVAKIVTTAPASPRDTLVGAVVGTPHYMAPEQAGGLTVDHRIDIYALGCIFYELLTGRVPFDAATPAAVMSLQMTAPIPPLSSPYGPIPVGIDQIGRRALAKAPAERYPSIEAMNADLDRVVAVVTRLGWRRWLAS